MKNQPKTKPSNHHADVRKRPTPESAVKFIMLGGFLGAGKTTMVLQLALRLQRAGKKVGIITNDQAAGLVDTALAEELNLPVREIAGGCFCCRSDRLVEALQELEAQRKPDFYIAEPVGSCTDLIATVTLPLKQIYQKEFVIAPYAVLVDPFRALQTLAPHGASAFSSNVNYIYRKQLEEAEIIVINKLDVVNASQLSLLRRTLALDYPDARVVEVSARKGVGLEPLFDLLLDESSRPKRVMEVDYARYGAGEAELGWYNGRFQVAAPKARQEIPAPIANEWLARLAKSIHESLREQKIEVAHFKAVLKAEIKTHARKDDSALAVINLVRSDGSPDVARSLTLPMINGTLLVNLRAAGAPDDLERAVSESMDAAGAHLKTHLFRKEVFRPGQPNPIHRLNSL